MSLRLSAPLVALLVLAGCDSGNDDDLFLALQGTYQLDELSFDPATSSLPTADVGARLDLDDTVLQLFGDGTGQFIVFDGSTGLSSRIELLYDPSSTRASFEAETDRDGDSLSELLLPEEFSLTYQGDRATQLTGSFDVSGVDLESFDPAVYQDQRSNRGTLTIRFSRP
ncbi:MAG: hypothetical protein AAGK21_10400 [Bacteroidota bacterium]